MHVDTIFRIVSFSRSPNLAWLLAAWLISVNSAIAVHAGDESNPSPRPSRDYDYEVPIAGSYTLPIIKGAADGEALDSHGKPVRLRELMLGRITVLSFIYTRCAAARACPYATGVLLQLHQQSATDPELGKALHLISMSFDPANDTPERMASYARLAASHPEGSAWDFLTSKSQAELQPVLNAYGQAVDRKKNAFDPTGPLNHTLRVLLIDSAGNIRNIYSSGTLDIRLVLADVRTLMQERSNREHKQ